jgi:hypothetical protein
MQVTDPVCRMTIDSEQAAGREVWQGQTIISAPSPVAEIPCSSWALRQQDRQTCGRCASQLSGRARRSKRALGGPTLSVSPLRPSEDGRAIDMDQAPISAIKY